MNQLEVREAAGYGPPGGGYPQGGGYGGGFGAPPPQPGGFGPPPGGFGPPPGGFGQPPGGFGQPGGGYPGMPPMRPQTEPVGIISLISGVIAMATNCCCSFLGIPFSVIAIITGIVSLMRIRNNPQRFTGKVYGWLGIAIGVGGILILIVSLLVGIGPAVLEEIKRNL